LQFDPSGRYLGLYTGARSPDQFWKIPLDGTPPTELLHGTGAPAGSFAWLNGGLRIVSDAWAAIVDSRLLLSDLASGERRALTTELEPEYSPAVAPNGHTLAFAAGETGYDIIDVPLDGSAPHDLIATSRNEVAPAWTPDGGHVAYATNRNNVSEIWLRNVTDRSERRIVGATSFPDSADYVLWDTAISPDGSRIAYRRVASGVHEIWISPLSGEGAVRLRDDPAKSTQRGPSWSPDGNWIAYYGTREGTPAVFKMRVGANGPPEFLATMATMQPVRWSPRGDWIAFRDGETLRVVRVDGTHNHVVNGRAWETFDWSKDGAAILGITFDGQHRQRLARIEVDTGQETGIADLGPVPAALDFANYRGQFAYRGFALHPDGRRFLTSLLQVKTQIYFMEDLDRPTRLADKLWRRMGGKTP
jgi:hypothetical protein